MKKVNEILSHLKSNPTFRRINTASNIKNVIDALDFKLKKGVKFAYIKNQTLFFVLTHPVFKSEFEYNKVMIKSLLKKADIDDVKDIKFFVSNKKEKKAEIKQVELKYKERSYGIFENNIKDKKLHKVFEEIRNIIKDK